MRRGLAAGAVLTTSLLVAGCDGGLLGGESEPPVETAPSVQPSPTSETKQPERTAPVKSLELADKCSIVSEERASSFGADQPPRQRDFEGVSGCSYDKGVSGADFMAFAAVNKQETMQEYAEMRKSSAESTEIVGYPAVEVAVGSTNCFVSVDIADQGSLFVSGLVPKDEPEPCGLATKFAEAAVENLPDA